MNNLQLAEQDRNEIYIRYLRAPSAGNFALKERLNDANNEVRRIKRLIEKVTELRKKRKGAES